MDHNEIKLRLDNDYRVSYQNELIRLNWKIY